MGIAAAMPKKRNQYTREQLLAIKKQMEANPAAADLDPQTRLVLEESNLQAPKTATFFQQAKKDNSTDQIEQETSYQL